MARQSVVKQRWTRHVLTGITAIVMCVSAAAVPAANASPAPPSPPSAAAVALGNHDLSSGRSSVLAHAPKPRTNAPAAVATASSAVRQAVVNAAESYLNRPYRLEYGWTCSFDAMDCECLNRHAIWDGTHNATGTGLQLWYTLQGQINEGYQVSSPRLGDLVFWDTDPNDGNPYGGDEDHTGIYVGGGYVVDANAYYGYVKYDTVTLNGAYPYPIYIDVLSANGY